MDIIMPVLLGLERICADEVIDLGYDESKVKLEDGLVRLSVGTDPKEVAAAIARLNVNLATAERVELEVFQFGARSFDDFFDRAEALSWESVIPEDAVFIVNGYSRRSELFSVTDLQRLLKKAIVNRLLDKRYPGRSLVPERESAGVLNIKFAFLDDVCSFRLDTTGEGLHKRGYRLQAGDAPLSETLAAALLRICRWAPYSDEALFDPFCGSGTIAIEAAMMAAGIAPGVNRYFAADRWSDLYRQSFKAAKEEARAAETADAPDELFIFGSDLDPSVLAVAEENAIRAGVRDFIDFRRMDARDLTKERLDDITKLERQQIVGNPPYGERMLREEDIRDLHYDLGKQLLDGDELAKGLRIAFITSSEDFEYDFGRVADKRRKLYNGMIKCTFYQYFRRYPKRKPNYR